jgi:hypothetical protein
MTNLSCNQIIATGVRYPGSSKGQQQLRAVETVTSGSAGFRYQEAQEAEASMSQTSTVD